MNKFARFCISLAALLSLSATTHAEEIKGGMNALLAPLRSLERYIANENEFSDPRNAKAISDILQSLRTNFHSIEQIPSRYHSLEGFDMALTQVTELLDDASRRFNEGKAHYAWWRLRTLSSNCFACHATYKVSSTLNAADSVDPSLDLMQQARFMLATRQFPEAKEKLKSALQNPEYRFFYDEALRSLLLVGTRIEKRPAETITLFQEILSGSKLPEEDVHQVRVWIESLKKWRDSPTKPQDPLKEGEQLIVKGATKGIDYHQDDVSLLRGTAMLHSALEGEKLKPEARSKALYLLGFAYEQMPLFFAESWAEMYLEQCINEFPGTADAKRAYRVLREHIVDDFTGSGGTDIPDEVSLRLDELRKKAYGEPSFNGKV